jgi:hypothetical protein
VPVRFEAITYANVESGSPCPSTCAAAAINGHVDFFVWAHENGCEIYSFYFSLLRIVDT